MNAPPSPSKRAEQLLLWMVNDPAIVGDLREEYARHSRRVGVTKARRWHWRQAAGITCRYGVHRLFRRNPPQRWIAVAAEDPGASWHAGVLRDVLYAWRAITQRPALSAVIVITLSLALAANSAIFSFMDALVLRPYRFPGVDRLVIVGTNSPDQTFFDQESVAPADFRDWQREAKSVRQWAAYLWWDANLSGVDIPEQVPGFRVTPGYFATLGVAPALGREFLEEEAQQGKHQRVMLGHGLWTRRFGANPAIVGTMVRLDGEPYEVVGVAPEGFQIPLGAEVWSPLAYTDQQWLDRRSGNLSAVGLLADGASLENARAELIGIIDRQRRDYPDTNSNRGAQVLSFTEGMADPGAGPFLTVSQVAALLLLVIACANIANLLMARGSERAPEYALRLALGASRSRLFAQTVLEGLILSVLAIALAMPLAAAALALGRASIPASVIRFVAGWRFLHVDTMLFVITAALAMAATLVFSLVPALQATRAQVADTLKQSGRATSSRSRQWLRSALATAQVALALALLFASGLMLSAADRTVNGVLGFDKQNVLVGQLNLPARTYEDAEKRRQFISRVLDGMQGIPAISHAGTTSNVPAGLGNNSRQFWPEGVELAEADARFVNYRRATAGYFGTLRIPLLQGRLFDDSDRIDGTPVAVVSAGLARLYWPDQDPIGKRFKVSSDGPWINVIGVTGDVVHNWFIQRRDTTVYRPLSQEVPYSVAFTFRVIGDPNSLAGDLRRAVAAADPDQPIASLNSLEMLVEDRAGGFIFIAQALGVVALIALVLSITGIYSLMAFLTSQRTQEIGVRMALGARRSQVVLLATARAWRITLVGIVIGAALSFGIGRLMRSFLFGLVSTNIVQLVSIVMMIAVAALLAAYLPARRAANTDPMAALREV